MSGVVYKPPSSWASLLALSFFFKYSSSCCCAGRLPRVGRHLFCGGSWWEEVWMASPQGGEAAQDLPQAPALRCSGIGLQLFKLLPMS